MPILVVHKHDASHLHYDFRLELDGVLKSWAVPKEPPQEQGIKRLAMLVTDHPLSYAHFEGVIPEGYGAGTVEIWDKGPFDLIHVDQKKIVVDLHGEKLIGKYVLVVFSKVKNGWLLYKE